MIQLLVELEYGLGLMVDVTGNIGADGWIVVTRAGQMSRSMDKWTVFGVTLYAQREFLPAEKAGLEVCWNRLGHLDFLDLKSSESGGKQTFHRGQAKWKDINAALNRAQAEWQALSEEETGPTSEAGLKLICVVEEEEDGHP